VSFLYETQKDRSLFAFYHILFSRNDLIYRLEVNWWAERYYYTEHTNFSFLEFEVLTAVDVSEEHVSSNFRVGE
jgi:hypothetical protein